MPEPATIPSPLSVSAAAYATACQAAHVSGGHPAALDRYQRLYRLGHFDQTNLSVSPARITRTHESECSEGRIVKLALALTPRPDRPGEQLETESVVIPMIGKKRVLTHTLCVSSQVGCAMGCTFCQTAQMGLLRNLTPDEIVQQWLVARHFAPNPLTPDSTGFSSIRNIVFMGMGEPMDNLDNVIAAIEVLTDHRGPNLPMSRISISTVGRVDGIHALAAKVRDPGWHRLNLAVSLNAPNDQVRSLIMPINRRYPLSDLRTALEAWPIYGAAKICFEYVLIPGVNDRPEHAHELGDFVLGRGEYAGRPPLQGLVNLIPYNPREQSPWPAPDEPAVDRFLGWLHEAGTYAKRRRTKGRDTMSACGQLGNPSLRSRPRTSVPVQLGIANLPALTQ